MAPITQQLPNGISSDSDNESDTSYDMAEDTMSPISATSSKRTGEARKPEKVDNLSFDDAVNGPVGEEPNSHDEQSSMLTSWISKISGIPIYRATDVARNRDSIEKRWLQSARQTTGDSDGESVIGNDSGLGSREVQTDENFTDLQLDADLQSARTIIQTEAETILRILDDIHLSDETAVPRDISVRLQKHARTITCIFGDDIVSLKRKIKDQNEEMQELIYKHAAECARTNTATNETICRLGKEKDEEIKRMQWRHRSDSQEVRNQYKENEQQYRKQLALFKQKIELLEVDYPAFRALKEEHEQLKQQLRVSEAQTSRLESRIQQCQDLQVCTNAQLAHANDVISRLRYDKAANNEKLVDSVHKAQGFEAGRDAALFKVSELGNEVDDLKARFEGSKKRDAELILALEREEKVNQKLVKAEKLQSTDIKCLRHDNELLLKEIEVIKLRESEHSQRYQVLKEDNSVLKQALQVKRAAHRTAKLSFEKDILEIISSVHAHQDQNEAMELENASLKDKVAQIKAQLEHARTGNKCTRDALAQLNEELKASSESKEKDNWVLRQALVHAWTQVETLGQRLKQEQENTLLNARSETSGRQNEPNSAEEAIRPCGHCLTAKLELSNFQKHMVKHHKEKEDIKKDLCKSRGDNANLQEQLKQANANIIRLQDDASIVQHYHQKLKKRADKIKDEREELERQLHTTQFELSGENSRLRISESEAKNLREEVIACKNELELAKEKLGEDDDVDNKMTQRHCLVLIQQQAALKLRAEGAEKVAREEKERFRNLWGEVQKNVEELMRRTGGLGSSSREVLGLLAIDEPEGSCD